MGLEVYYPQDIRNALLAAEQANNAAMMALGGEDAADPAQSTFVQGYGAGYRAALVTIALAFGLIRPDGFDPVLSSTGQGQSTEWQQMFLPANERSRRRQ
jgi:hypothetical protein